VTPFDCELIRHGLLAQPVNTVSALAFVLAAWWLWRRDRRGIAAVLAAAGLGSMWFHAQPSGAASWAHDVGLYALLAVAAIEVWRVLAKRRRPILAAAVFGVGLAVWAVSRTGGPLCDPDSLLQGHAAWHVLAAAAGTILFAAEAPEPTIKAE
jgi:hypothetical protein